MKLERNPLRDDLEYGTVRSVSKLLLGAVSVCFLAYLISLLPRIA